jgi:hypothetical protein
MRSDSVSSSFSVSLYETRLANSNLGPGFAIDGLVGRVDDPLIGRDNDDCPNGATNPTFTVGPAPGGVGDSSGDDGPNGVTNPQITTVFVPGGVGEGSG